MPPMDDSSARSDAADPAEELAAEGIRPFWRLVASTCLARRARSGRCAPRRRRSRTNVRKPARREGFRTFARETSAARRRRSSDVEGERVLPGRALRLGSLAPAIPVRDDLRALEGYHSPQVDVTVRLNTNESPPPPPAAWRDAFAAELSRVEWHRYPDRAATELRAAIAALHGVGARAGVRGQRLQRGAADAAAHLRRRAVARSPRSSRPTSCTPTSPASPARAVVEGERAADFSLDLDEVRTGRRRAARRSSRSCARRTTRPGMVEPRGRGARGRSTWRPASSSSTRPTGSSPPWSALDAGRRGRARSSSPARSRRRGRWPPPGSATWSARRGSSSELEKVVLPYHLDAAKQIAGRLALRFADEMEARVRLIVEERERVAAGARATCRSTSWPSRRQLHPVPPAGASTASDVWQALLDRGVLVRDCSAWPRLDGCLRVTVGTPDEDDAFLAALARCCRERPQPLGDRERHDQGDDDRRRDRPRRQRAHRGHRPACRSSTTCSTSSAATAGSTCGRRPPAT